MKERLNKKFQRIAQIKLDFSVNSTNNFSKLSTQRGLLLFLRHPIELIKQLLKKTPFKGKIHDCFTINPTEMNNNKRQKLQTRRTIYCYLVFTLFGRLYFPRFFFTIKRQLFKTEAYL